VTYGVREAAVRWLSEVKACFTMVQEPTRKIYKLLGLKRSLAQVWNVGVLAYYAEQICANRALPQTHDNVDDDPHQMGGDFMCSSSGQLTLAHCSKHPLDRPSVSDILQAAKSGLQSS